MADFIDRKKAIKHIKQKIIALAVQKGGARVLSDVISDGEIYSLIEEWINEVKPNQPEIIRCYKCKYWPNRPRSYADNDPVEMYFHCEYMGENDWCSKAKRRDDDDSD